MTDLSNTYSALNCQEHGAYKPYGVVAGRQCGTQCPSCEKQKAIAKMTDISGIPARYLKTTFDSYKATTEEQSASLDCCRRFADEVLAGRDGHLLLIGKPGTGKTHLGCAVAHASISEGKLAWYGTARELIRVIRSTWARGSERSEASVIDDYARVPLLVLDEVGAQLGTESEILSLFDVLDGRYAAQLPTLVISNFDMASLKQHLGDRLIDRLRHNGRVITMTGESFRKAA